MKRYMIRLLGVAGLSAFPLAVFWGSTSREGGETSRRKESRTARSFRDEVG